MKKQAGFTIIELLVTLFVAAMFLIAGYQLYITVLRADGQTRAQAIAQNTARDYLERYRASVPSPCLANMPMTDSPITIEGLTNATISVTVTCPGSGSLSTLSSINVVVKYGTGNPQAQVAFAGWSYTASGATYDMGLTMTSLANNQVSFLWTSVAGATAYQVTVVGSDGTNITKTTNDLMYTTTINPSVTATVSVAAMSGSSVGAAASVAVTGPTWQDLSLQSGWQQYQVGSAQYGTARFTKTSAGVVVLSGLIKSGTNTNGTVIATLPAGYAPMYGPQVFVVACSGTAGNPDAYTSLDVSTDGTIRIDRNITTIPSNGSAWLSLDGVSFLAADASGATRLDPHWQNGWGQYSSGGWATHDSIDTDSLGRVWISGLAVGPSVLSDGQTIMDNLPGMPGAVASGWGSYSPVMSNNVFGAVHTNTSGALTTSSYLSTTYVAFDNQYDTSPGNFMALTLQNSWIPRTSTGAASPGYAKYADGLVMLRGSIAGGTATNGTVIATLPAGYRPDATEIFPIQNNGSEARLDVYTDGRVMINGDGSSMNNGALSLDGISFMTAISPTIPTVNWHYSTLNAGWSLYDDSARSRPLAHPQFTRTAAGVVVLEGIVSGNAIGTPMFTLPLWYRPSAHLLIAISSDNGGTCRLEITTDGVVTVVSCDTTTGWVSLSGVTFMAADTPAQTTATMANSWTALGSGWAPLQYVVDPLGRTHVQGVVGGGTVAQETVVGTLSSAAASPEYIHILTQSVDHYAHYSVNNTSIFAKTPYFLATWAAVNGMYLTANPTSTWTPLTLQNSWVWYGANSTYHYSEPRYTKAPDGIVTLAGLIKAGTISANTIIANLPAGYRPAKDLIFTIPSADKDERIDITAAGDIVWVTGNGSNSWAALDGISFMADD